jgi:adenylate cyclase class IV
MGKHTEIELKARVHAYGDCRRRLSELAGGGSAFVKDDAYWFSVQQGDALPSVSGLRVRTERHTGAEGQTTERTLVTNKTKERRDGIEINEEHEFEVSNGGAFEELLEKLGLEKRIYKHKAGWAWTIEGITAELAEVSGSTVRAAGLPAAECSADPGGGTPGAQQKNLGWFLELEILAAGGGDEIIAAARRRLLDLLKKAGIGEEDIEDRYYSRLLSG